MPHSHHSGDNADVDMKARAAGGARVHEENEEAPYDESFQDFEPYKAKSTSDYVSLFFRVSADAVVHTALIMTPKRNIKSADLYNLMFPYERVGYLHGGHKPPKDSKGLRKSAGEPGGSLDANGSKGKKSAVQKEGPNDSDDVQVESGRGGQHKHSANGVDRTSNHPEKNQTVQFSDQKPDFTGPAAQQPTYIVQQPISVQQSTTAVQPTTTIISSIQQPITLVSASGMPIQVSPVLNNVVQQPVNYFTPAISAGQTALLYSVPIQASAATQQTYFTPVGQQPSAGFTQGAPQTISGQDLSQDLSRLSVNDGSAPSHPYANGSGSSNHGLSSTGAAYSQSSANGASSFQPSTNGAPSSPNGLNPRSKAKKQQLQNSLNNKHHHIGRRRMRNFEDQHASYNNRSGGEGTTDSGEKDVQVSGNPLKQVGPSTDFHLPFLIIDCRRKDEFKESHIHGAFNIHYAKSESIDIPEWVKKETLIVTYCAVGLRSGLMQYKLRHMGFLDVRVLSGGYYKWVNEKRPIFSHKGEAETVLQQHSVAGLMLRKDARRTEQMIKQEKDKVKNKAPERDFANRDWDPKQGWGATPGSTREL